MAQLSNVPTPLDRFFTNHIIIINNSNSYLRGDERQLGEVDGVEERPVDDRAELDAVRGQPEDVGEDVDDLLGDEAPLDHDVGVPLRVGGGHQLLEVGAAVVGEEHLGGLVLVLLDLTKKRMGL